MSFAIRFAHRKSHAESTAAAQHGVRRLVRRRPKVQGTTSAFLILGVISTIPALFGGAADSLLTDGRIAPLTASLLKLFSLPIGFGIHTGFQITGSFIVAMIFGFIAHTAVVYGACSIVLRIVRYARSAIS